MDTVDTNVQYERYPAYKDSGVEWLGEIPEGWKVQRLAVLGTFSKGGGFSKKDLAKEGKVAVLYGDLYTRYHITIKHVSRFIPVKVANLSTAIYQGDLLFAGSGESVEEIGKCVMYDMTKEGLAGGDIIIFRQLKHNSYFLSFYLNSWGPRFEMSRSAKGEIIVHTYSSKLRELQVPLPPLPEQTAIAQFLDDKCQKIDQAIAQKKKMIQLLEERKQILIQNAVTKGLDPSVEMKDSGIEWIGEIPEHWEVKRLKYVLKERNERSETGEEVLLMMSQKHGLVVRSDYHDKAEVALSTVGNKKVYYNDLVFNKLKAHLGVFFKSNIELVGLVSPDYAVYYSDGLISDTKLLEYLFRHPAYIGQFISRATGIVEGLIRLYTSDLFAIEIPLPNIEEQQEILSYIHKKSDFIDKSVLLQQQQIQKLKEYKTILINQTVTGKIKVS